MKGQILNHKKIMYFQKAKTSKTMHSLYLNWFNMLPNFDDIDHIHILGSCLVTAAVNAFNSGHRNA